jgi:hypothetical protein
MGWVPGLEIVNGKSCCNHLRDQEFLLNATNGGVEGDLGFIRPS